jgi:hypothetical protein
MQPNTMKSAMQNGLILGVIFSINFLLSTSKITTLILLTYIIAIVIVATIYNFTIRYRDNESDGAISYGKAFKYIIYLFFYAALISTVVKYVYFRFINTGYLETMFQETMKMMEMLKFPMNSAEIDQTEKMFNPLSFSLLYIWSDIIMGAVVALIMAAFVKKEKDIFSQQ